MRDARPYGFAAMLAILALGAAKRKHWKRHPQPPRELTEVEAWNAEVERKRAEKKARKKEDTK